MEGVLVGTERLHISTICLEDHQQLDGVNTGALIEHCQDTLEQGTQTHLTVCNNLASHPHPHQLLC